MDRKPRIARYNLVERAKWFGLFNRDMCRLLEERGVPCYESQYTNAIYGRRQGPKDDKICDTADRILREMERKETEGLKKNY